jgi:hypothetical protein
MEIKLLLSVQYVMMQDYELFNQLLSSIQRQIRILGKEDCSYIVLFTKILKTISTNNKTNKTEKISVLLDKLAAAPRKSFSPTSYVKFSNKVLAER